MPQACGDGYSWWPNQIPVSPFSDIVILPPASVCRAVNDLHMWLSSLYSWNTGHIPLVPHPWPQPMALSKWLSNKGTPKPKAKAPSLDRGQTLRCKMYYITTHRIRLRLEFDLKSYFAWFFTLFVFLPHSLIHFFRENFLNTYLNFEFLL